jgi:hypothetical protein
VATFDRAQIKQALALTDPAISSFLDIQTGQVVQLIEGDTSPEQIALGDTVMEGVGERYRYIPGGNPAADDSSIDGWLEAEGIS